VDRVGGCAEDAVKHGILLAAAVILAAFLRFDGLGEPSYWLDEILHQNLTTEAAAQPWWKWIAGFSPEHGPLYYATQLAARPFGTGEAAGRLPAALLGVATIPLVWLAARSFGGRDSVAAPAAAMLLAISPLHVYYSREARTYALLMFLAAALIVVLLQARSIAAACVVLVALLYSSATAAPIVAGGFLVALAAALFAKERQVRRWYIIVAAVALSTLVLFRFIYASEPVASLEWPPFPRMDVNFFAKLMRVFSVSALGADIRGRAAAAVLLLALTGAVVAWKGNRIAGVVLTGMTLLPLAIILASLRFLNHFYADRYVTPALVGYLLLAACGIGALAAMAKRAALPVALLIVLVIGTQSWMSARSEPFQKLDWRGIAGKIHRYAHRGDQVIAAEAWSEVSLRYYLRQLPPRVRLEGIPYAVVAEAATFGHPGTWLVTAGHGSNETRNWMCRYPPVLASPLENFRLHYAGDFLRERGGPAEGRALLAAGHNPPPDPAAHDEYLIRMASMPFIDERSAWRNTPTRFPPDRLRRDAVAALVGRLGFDPAELVPRLVGGEVHLDDIVETVAYGSDCEDDGAFVRRAFAILLERPPNQDEERELAKLPRAVLPGRMIKSDEFRRRMLVAQNVRAR
jgi:hypothetical protein